MDTITDEQKEVMDELRKRTISDLSPKLLEDRTLFYRFSKARDFDIDEAEAMLRKHISWRMEYQMDTILTDYDPPKIGMEYGASSFVCFDKEGGAVRLQDWGHLDSKGLSTIFTKPEVVKVWFYLAEKDREAVIKKGGDTGRPIFHPIYDLKDWSYAKSIHMKSLGYLLYGVKNLIDNFPECVKKITIINAPLYFALCFGLLKTVLPLSVSQKMRVFGKDGWKEALLEDIDAEVLPAYLGGNKTDPDGNPRCETFIQYGKPIPKFLMMENEEKRLALDPEAEKLTVKPFAKEEIILEVKEAKSCIRWEFEIKKGDIEFSLTFRDEDSENLEPVELIRKQRIDTSSKYEKGSFKCEKIGEYTMVFDNSHSWLHSKEVYYKARITNPKENVS